MSTLKFLAAMTALAAACLRLILAHRWTAEVEQVSAYAARDWRGYNDEQQLHNDELRVRNDELHQETEQLEREARQR
jgi:hypothetical protein